ncbi:MAG TPA: hypothetical protein VLB79_11630 [Solirubrobacterales bacterium]|nr:hypothetical protein [Solirubrobacterales bacterium]
MNDVVRDFFVCGFGDLPAGLGGLAWDFGQPGALLLVERDARPASFALEEGGDALTLEITADDSTVNATLSPRTAEIALDDGSGLTAVVCVADVSPRGASGTVQCPGQLSRWSSNPVEGAGTFRHLAIDGGEESLLVAVARGEPGADHGEERTAGWLIRGEEESPFEDSFVSTQYGANDDPTRFGLELWPEDSERASRAAAMRASASSLGGTRIGNAWAGLFGCHTDGSEGIGSYLLWRA